MGYERVQLVEVASIRGGKRLPAGREFTTTQTAHPYIRARDIGGGKVEVHDPVFLDEVTAQKLVRYTVNKGDVCLTIVGANVGEMGVVPSHLDGANLTENAVKIVTNGKADQSFLKYALLGDDAMAQMKVLAGGAAQPKLGIYKIETIEFPCPPLQVQRRIASILSAYDELIENNQQRIRILEDMARSLYREWFVHFRYPGHESVPPVDSPLGQIPQGWEMRNVKDIANVTYGCALKSQSFNADGNGLPVVRIRDIPTGASETYSAEECDEKYRINDGHILVGMDGDFHMCIWSNGLALQNQRVARFESQSEIGNYHLFLALERPIQEFNMAIVGTTVAHLGDMHIKTIPIVWPPSALRGKAKEILEPLSEQVITLKRQTANLRRTRDLLLPRLLSGQVSLVEA